MSNLTADNIKIIQNAIDNWLDDGLIDSATATALHENVVHKEEKYDWTSVAKYFLYLSVACLVLSVTSVQEMRALQRLIDTIPYIFKFVLAMATSLVSYQLACERKLFQPKKVYSIQCLFAIGAVFMSVASSYLEMTLRTIDPFQLEYRDNIVHQVVSPLFVVMYGILAYRFRSHLLWLMTLLSSANCLIFQRYECFPYFVEFHSPHACILFGLFVIVSSSYLGNRLGWFKSFSTLTLVVGLSYYFVALWSVTLWGYPLGWHGTHYVAYDVLMTISIGIAIWSGLKYRNSFLKSFGYAFLFIYTVTKYSDMFLKPIIPRTIVFAILAVAAWCVGSGAEKVESMQVVNAKRTKETSSQNENVVYLL